MNYSTAIFLISDDVKCVKAIYEPLEDNSKAKSVPFKTFENLAVGDFVVVPTDTRHKMTVVKVVEVNVEPDLDDPTPIDWVICSADPGVHKALAANEAAMIEKIQSAEKRRKREELRESLRAAAGDGILALDVRPDLAGDASPTEEPNT